MLDTDKSFHSETFVICCITLFKCSILHESALDFDNFFCPSHKSKSSCMPVCRTTTLTLILNLTFTHKPNSLPQSTS